MRGFAIAVFALSALWSSSLSAQVTPFERLVGEAFEDFPTSRAIRNRADAVDTQAGALEVWKDPQASLTLSNVPWKELSLAEHPMSGVELKAMQPIPYPGKLEADASVVRATADVMRARADVMEIGLARMAVGPYFNLVEIDAQLPVLRRQLALVEELIALAEARYGAGGAPASDALRGRLEKARLSRRIRILEAQRGREVARVNAALRRRPDAAVDAVAETAAPLRSLAELEALAEERRPEFAVLQEEEAMHRDAMRAERLKARPDFSVGASWRFRTADDNLDGRDFFSLFVGVDIPVWSGDAAVTRNRGHRALIDALDDDREAIRRDIRGRIAVLLSQLTLVEEELAAIREHDLPEARNLQRYLRAEYPTRDSDFLALLDAEQRLLELELSSAVLKSRRARYHQEIRIETAEARPSAQRN